LTLFISLNSNYIAPANPCICGNAKSILGHQNQDRAMEFLQGVHSRFSVVRGQILLTDLFPSIQCINNLVRREEKQQEISFRLLLAEESA
jgi:calcineurin-like phosphoesterase